MKKLMVSAAFLLAALLATGQQKVTTDKNGNYIAVPSSTGIKKDSYKATGKTFTDSKGKTYPVYISERGKLFYIRVTQSGKNIGKEYRAYIEQQQTTTTK